MLTPWKIKFWGGPKDGHVEYQMAHPKENIYFSLDTFDQLDSNNSHYISLAYSYTTKENHAATKDLNAEDKILKYKFNGIVSIK